VVGDGVVNRSERPLAVVDDDPDDLMLIGRALAKTRIGSKVVEFGDGSELLDYLRSDHGRGPGRPVLIMLDLNMPKVDGRETLKQIKADPTLSEIPVVVFTTSSHEKDITESYRLGASSFITKPFSFPKMIDTFEVIDSYWTGAVQTP